MLVTGAAGFIGYHVAGRLLKQGVQVTGLDNLNAYYDVRLKEARRDRLCLNSGFTFEAIDLADRDGMSRLFERGRFDRVIHLGAQAGVRYSIQEPHAYVASNLVGFLNVLEGCRVCGVEHLVYASSSSVYGANRTMPFSEHAAVDHPISFYAATKRANELMAHSYAAVHGLPCTGLRFFTVYGPWGRPDMALFLFTKAILEDRPIDVFNHGDMRRDFTYIDDIVEGVLRIADRIPKPDPSWSASNPDPATSFLPYRVYNIGNNHPEALLDVIGILEKSIGKQAIKKYLPMQPGDVVETYADVTDLTNAVGFSPSTPIEVGVPKFVAWYREFYGV